MDTSLIQGIEAIKTPVGVYSPIDPQAAWYRDQFLDAGIPLPDRIGLWEPVIYIHHAFPRTFFDHGRFPLEINWF